MRDAVRDRNLTALAQRAPGLARIVADAGPLPGSERISTRSGDETLMAPGPDGRPVPLASKYDPVSEARRAIPGMAFERAETLVVKGFGLGYHLLEMARQARADQFVVVIEPDPRVVFEAFCTHDLTEVVSSAQFDFLFGLDLTAFVPLLVSRLRRFLVENALLVPHAPSIRLNGPFFEQVTAMLTKALEFTVVDLQTQTQFGGLFCANSVANIPALARAHPVGPLAGVYSGRPGFCIAAGPSLGTNLSQLRGLEDGGVIVCVDTVLPTLVAAGVRPDVVVAIDPHPTKLNFMTSVDGAHAEYRSPPLLFDQEVCPEVPRTYPGPLIAFNLENKFGRWTRELLGDLGCLPKGSTVAHSAFFMLRHLGCDPIVLLGVDLGYPGSETHVSGAARTWSLTPGVGPDTRMSVDVFGRPLVTQANFLAFLTRFESEIAETPARCIDATEGGVRIEGTDVMSLREAMVVSGLARHEAKPALASLLPPPRSDAKPGQLKHDLDHRCTDLARLERLCGDILDSLDRLCDSGASGRSASLRGLQRLIKEYVAQQDLLGFLELQMARAFLEFIATGAGTLVDAVVDLDTAEENAERVRSFVGACRIACVDLQRALNLLTCEPLGIAS